MRLDGLVSSPMLYSIC